MTNAPPFSLCEGGRFHAALTRAGLAGGPRGRIILVGVLLALGWLPLLLLSAAGGTALRGVDHPFLTDLGAWVRFVIVIPILVFAEPMADRVLGLVVQLYRRSGLVRDADLPTFDSAVDRAMRRATSDTAELLLLLTALTFPHLLVASLPHLPAGTAWFGTAIDGQVRISAAGRWYAWVALPLVQFLLLRWFWRIGAWWQLAWRVSKLDLSWAAAHPDAAGGLGFFVWSPRAFRSVFVGLSTLAAAAASNQIQFGGRSLTDARTGILALIVCECLLLLAPQFFFMKALLRARYAALVGYGLTATAMTREFERRVMDPEASRGTELLDSPRSSAMIDYASTYGLVTAMRTTGISLREILAIVVPIAAPFAPLLLYEYSLKQIVQEVLQLVR